VELLFSFQEWSYKETFKISRSANANSALFVAYIKDGDLVGRGECGLLPQYGQTQQDAEEGFILAQTLIHQGLSREELPLKIVNPSVRNAIDCALWDLECKRSGQDIWTLTGLPKATSIEVDLTISVNPVDKMCADAVIAVANGYRILKLKADKNDVVAKVAAIASAVPGIEFIIDANEAWDLKTLHDSCDQLHTLGVKLIEQPLHHQSDDELIDYRGPIPLCADESCGSIGDLDRLASLYQSINIKLDKVGGLTPGLELARAARRANMKIMLGCGGPTSLGAAPAYVLATLCDYVDLDGPALMLDDRAHAMIYIDGQLRCFGPALWGG